MKWLKLLGVLATVLSALTGAAISIHTITTTFKDPVAAASVDEHKKYMSETRAMVSKNREMLVQIALEIAKGKHRPAPVRVGVMPRTLRKMSKPAPPPRPPRRVVLTPPDKLFKKLRELPKINDEAPSSYDQMQQQLKK